MPDLRERQHAYIPIVLQCTLADVKQLAHITVVQPIGMLALFSKCLMAGLSKAKYLISEPCPIWIRNDKISHNSIVVLFVILSYWYWQYLCLFCVSSHVYVCKSMMSLSYFKAAGNSREISGTSRKKTMHFISSRLHLLTLFFFFHRPLGTKIWCCISYSIVIRPSGSLWHSWCGQTLPYFCADSIVCNIGVEYCKRVQRAHFYLCLFLLFYPPSWLSSGLNKFFLSPSP